MGESGSLLLYLVVILVIGAIPTIFVMNRSRQQGKAWQAFASQHGLAFDKPAGEAQVSGTYRGRSITIDTVVSRSGTISVANTRVRAAVKSVQPPTTEILRVPMPLSAKDRDKARSLRGYEDIVDIGDEMFDRFYLVRTSEGDHARTVLSGGTAFQQCVKDLYLASDLIKVVTGEAMVGAELNGRQTNMARLQKTLDTICDAADALDAGAK